MERWSTVGSSSGVRAATHHQTFGLRGVGDEVSVVVRVKPKV